MTASDTAAVVAAYAQAATDLRLPGCTGEDPQADARRFLAWTRQTDRDWLVVLDDIQDPADVAGWWPPADAGGRVLATTRRRDAALAGHGRRVVDVDIYTPDEARSYLTGQLTRPGHTAPDPGDVDGVAADLGYLPLALAQAAAYMIDAAISCADYRALLADRTRTLADLAPDALPDDHQQIVAATWSLSVERANSARPAGIARPLLELLSVLDPNGIPETVVTSPPALTRLHTDDPRRVRDGLRVLHRFSLITHTPTATGRKRAERDGRRG
ncbi:tetratricopeptide repeat protein, partial [Actinomadura kijaniata]